tara:strand:- start:241 stop:516 length:276 start_codon:yes stop_codon:yes gene_type:complete
MVGGKTAHLRKMVHQEDLVVEQDITVALQEVQVMFNLHLQYKDLLVELEVEWLILVLEVAELLRQELLEEQHVQVVVMVEEVYQIQFQVQH